MLDSWLCTLGLRHISGPFYLQIHTPGSTPQPLHSQKAHDLVWWVFPLTYCVDKEVVVHLFFPSGASAFGMAVLGRGDPFLSSPALRDAGKSRSAREEHPSPEPGQLGMQNDLKRHPGTAPGASPGNAAQTPGNRKRQKLRIFSYRSTVELSVCRRVCGYQNLRTL